MDAERLLFLMIVAVPSGLLVLLIGRLFGSVGAAGFTMVLAGMSGALFAASGNSPILQDPTLVALSVGVGIFVGYAVFALLQKRKPRVAAVRRRGGRA